MFDQANGSHRLRSPAALLVGSLAALAAVAGTARASAQAHNCEAQYDAARLVIATAIAGNDARDALQARGDDAWHAYWKERQPALAHRALDALDALLGSHAVRAVDAQSKTLVAEAAAALRRCIGGEAPAGTATLALSVLRFDETAPDGRGAPADAGVYVFVDGQQLARTDANGQATITVPAGLVAVQAIVPSTSLAQADVHAGVGATVALELVLDDSKEVTSPVQLSLGSGGGDVLAPGLDGFAITLLDGGVPRAAVAVAEVALVDDGGTTLEPLTGRFRVDGMGRLQPVGGLRLSQMVARYPGRRLVLRVMAEDALGFTLAGTVPIGPSPGERRDE